MPAYVVSVAVQVDGQSVAGAVADVVDGDAVLRGARSRRARASRRRDDAAAVQPRSTICQCRWWAPDSATTRSCAHDQAAVLAALLPQVRDIRRIGSAALDLCMVAAGRLDAYYEDGLNVWDWAAGALIAAEAGARVRLPPPTGRSAARDWWLRPRRASTSALTDALDRAGGLRAADVSGSAGARCGSW